jgi:hypothetical protein
MPDEPGGSGSQVARPDSDQSAQAAAALADIMRQRQAKSPKLTGKQERLLALVSSGAHTGYDFSRPETEADGLRVGAQRVLKARRQADALRRQAGSDAAGYTPGATKQDT